MTKFNVTIENKKTTYRMPFYFYDFFKRELNLNDTKIRELLNSKIEEYDLSRGYINRNEMINHLVFRHIQDFLENRKQKSFDL